MIPRELMELQQKIMRLIAIMIDKVTQHQNLTDADEAEFRKLSSEVASSLSTLQISNPNPFSNLKELLAFCKANYSTWADRRAYLRSLYVPILESINNALKQGQTGQSVSIELAENEDTISCRPLFKGRNFKANEKMVFVLMPFKPNFERIYTDHIRPALQDAGYQVLKANDLYTTSAIIEDIWEQITICRYVVADVTGKNANVFYELGIAHTLGKETIIITQDDADVPFDLKHIRYFKYDDTPNGWKYLRECLGKLTTK